MYQFWSLYPPVNDLSAALEVLCYSFVGFIDKHVCCG